MLDNNQKMRILTTNRHEIYLSLLAGVSAEIDVLTSVGKKDLPWRAQYGEVPPGLRLVNWDSQLEEHIRSNTYDVIILHTIEDLLAFRRFRGPRYIFVIHLALYAHSFAFKVRALIKKTILNVFLAAHDCRVVAVSPWKLSTWGSLPSPKVILLAPTEVIPADKTIDRVSVITVGNHFYTRAELNFDLLQFVMKTVPVTVCGLNPEIDGAILPKSRLDLLRIISEHRIYLYTTEYPWNDGYNTSVLEAMRAGLAVVAMAHPTSPVVHGKGGFLANTKQELIEYILKLSSNLALCCEFGEFNRKIVEEQFSNQSFIDNWNALLRERVTD